MKLAKKITAGAFSALMAAALISPAYAEEENLIEETVTLSAETAVGFTAADEWLGAIGTYPLRHIRTITIQLPKEVSAEGLSENSFTATDLEFRDDEARKNGVIEILGVKAEGRTITLTTTRHYAPGIMADPNEFAFRRKKVTIEIKANEDIKDTDGGILIAADNVLTLTEKDIHDPVIDRFEELILTGDNAGNPIYLMYSLPENYDEAKEYPMVFHITGGGQQYKKNTRYDQEIYGEDNYGVELDTDYVPYTFASYPEDTIVVSMQSIGQKDLQPEGYSAAVDADQAVKYFIDNYAVDPDRVYCVSNSQGGVILSEAVALHPEYFAAYVPCNTSIVMGTKNVTSEDTDSPVFQRCLDYVRSYIGEEVAISFNAGRNDPTGSWKDDQLPYELLLKEYAAAGYSEDEIADLVQIHTYEDEDFHAVGSNYYHGATGLMCENEEVLAWIYRQTRADNTGAVLEDAEGFDAYVYDKTAEATYKDEQISYTVPLYLVYPDHRLTKDGAAKLLGSMGLLNHVDGLHTKAVVINPQEDEYSEQDAETFLKAMDGLTGYSMNIKVIGIGKGADFVNTEVAKKDWAVSGILTYGGSEAVTPAYSVPAYISGSSEEVMKAYTEADNASESSVSGTLTAYVNPENHFETVVVNSEEETLAEAFANAWKTVFIKNGKVGNITGTWYTMPNSNERPYEYYTYLDCEELGLERTVVDDVDLDGDGRTNLWYEYVSEGAAAAEEKSVPAVVMLHGNANDPRTQSNTSGFAPLAAKEGIILIEPEWQGGIVSGVEFDAMTDNDSTTSGNDIIAMLEKVFEKYPQIDRERVYVEGLSRGGLNTVDIALTNPDVFAAAGSHSCGTRVNFLEILQNTVNEKKADYDTPFFFISGEKDHFIPLSAMGENGEVLKTIQLYQDLNEMDITEFSELSDDNGIYFGMELDNYGEIENEGNCTVYGGTLSNSYSEMISLNAIENWGHWNYEPAAQMMWDFFKAHTLYEGENHGLKLDQTEAEMPTRTTLQLSASEPVTWTSSDEKIATVDENGLVTALRYGKVTITATAENGETATCEIQTRYYDVNDDSKYYYEPVYWAADKAITKGYDNVYFGPQNNCTREAVVTFLWRLAGQPEPQSTQNPFKDVASNKYYYKAVLWAAEQGITKGYKDGTFRPDDTCLREHVVTFLYRYAGSPSVRPLTNPFNDVKMSDYYYRAAVWANQEGIAKGYSEGEHAGGFGPKLDCLREHVATFLYRYANN